MAEVLLGSCVVDHGLLVKGVFEDGFGAKQGWGASVR